MEKETVGEAAKRYAESVKGINHNKTAAFDFIKGYEYALNHQIWHDASVELPPLNTTVIVRKTGRWTNLGMLVNINDTGSKDEIRWVCGNSIRNWYVEQWMYLPS